MNHVTFETAKKLKAAGFPQTGHAWPQMYYWHRDFSDRVNTVLSEAEADAIEGPHTIVYAPTATELLPDGWYMHNSIGIWWVYETEERIAAMAEFITHRNPAEAAAAAWLHENATKTETI